MRPPCKQCGKPMGRKRPHSLPDNRCEECRGLDQRCKPNSKELRYARRKAERELFGRAA